MNTITEDERIDMRPRRYLGAFTTLLVLNFLVAVHHFSIVYVNSSFLGQFFSPELVSVVYIVASLCVMIILANAARLVARNGIWLIFLLAVPLLQMSVFFLGFAKNALSAVLFFVSQAVLIFILRYLMDLYLESLAENETTTGNTRSLFITAGNVGVFLGPLLASVIIIGSAFTPLYAFAAIILLPVFFIVLGPLRTIHPKKPKLPRFSESMKQLWCCRPNVRYVMAAHFLFQLFGAAIVIYAPLYLFEFGGLSWQAIGTLTALALLPYLIMEIPLGFLADRVVGEKEMMIIGLVVTGGAMAALSFTPLSLFILWSMWFIVTRIGGALLEISTESYFFKQVTEEDASLIGAFRMLGPLGAIGAPIVALISLLFVPLLYLFAIFGALMLLGIIPVLRLVDSR